MKKNISAQIALLQLLILAHIAEEYFFGFPVWATKHFGTTTNTWYVVSHVLLAPMYVVVLYGAYIGRKWGLLLSVVLQATIFINGLFHLTTTIMWHEYSPGVVSQIFIMPLTWVVYDLILRHKLLSLREVCAGSLIGTIVCILFVTSLRLHINL